MIDVDDIAVERRHWYREEHFAHQLGNDSARAVVEGRWGFFTSAIRDWSTDYRAQHDRSKRPLRVLDAGCGDGINLLGLSRIFGNLGIPVALTGIDYNPVRIERARTLGLDCRLEVGSLAATGFGDGDIDFVLFNHVLEHIPEKSAVLSELHRVTADGGLLIAGVPNEGCALAKLRNHVLQRSVMRTTDHVHFFTAPSLRRDLQIAGFEKVRVTGEGFFLPHLRLATAVGSYNGGRRVLTGLGKAIPSQAAGLIAVAHARHRADS